jgi:hypothetical protein
MGFKLMLASCNDVLHAKLTLFLLPMHIGQMENPGEDSSEDGRRDCGVMTVHLLLTAERHLAGKKAS